MNQIKKRVYKVGIGFITGRKSFQEVLSTYMNSWGDSVISTDKPIELCLFVAYDLAYNNTKSSDYTNIDIKFKKVLNEIHFIDRKFIQSECKSLTDHKILTDKEAHLFFEEGYAGKRNAIIYTAVKHKVDILLFLDDDEYPLAVKYENESENWTGQQILSTHLKYIDKANITNGYHCGYVSPIPNIQFNNILSEYDFQVFIEAISNDIINWKSMKSLMEHGNITYSLPIVMSNGAKEVEQIGGSKFITGSNLCLNLKNPIDVIPFYNPPGARGEDTFLATCLRDKTVLKVPCYTFHDGFSIYPSMLKGVLPKKLKHISIDNAYISERFYQTCIGWIRYKPLLMYITCRNEYLNILNTTRNNLKHSIPKLNGFFKTSKFNNIITELNNYDQNVEEHYMSYLLTQEIWLKLASYLTLLKTTN